MKENNQGMRKQEQKNQICVMEYVPPAPYLFRLSIPYLLLISYILAMLVLFMHLNPEYFHNVTYQT